VAAYEYPQQQKVRVGRGSRIKIKNNDERSRYVYENKQNADKMTGEKLDICVEVTRILQKILGWEGLCAEKLRFQGCWGRNLPQIFGCGPAMPRHYPGIGHTTRRGERPITA
jgi:hypothetical protein